LLGLYRRLFVWIERPYLHALAKGEHNEGGQKNMPTHCQPVNCAHRPECPLEFASRRSGNFLCSRWQPCGAVDSRETHHGENRFYRLQQTQRCSTERVLSCWSRLSQRPVIGAVRHTNLRRCRRSVPNYWCINRHDHACGKPPRQRAIAQRLVRWHRPADRRSATRCLQLKSKRTVGGRRRHRGTRPEAVLNGWLCHLDSSWQLPHHGLRRGM
jgi:hypothetical protein